MLKLPLNKVNPMRNLLTIGALLLTFLTSVAHANDVEITNDEERCVDRQISMDVSVKVGRDSFRFGPSCDFSFDSNFKTSGGSICRVRSGMCSDFSPKNLFEVQCDDGSSGAIPIKCPAAEIL
jgi:hypothetical protein